MRLLKLLCYILFAALLGSCDDSTLREPSAEFISYVNILSDSSYLTISEDIQFYDSLYYISDLKNARVVMLDNNLNLVKSIGDYGRGPGEFLSVTYMYIDEDSLYAYDGNKNRIIVFSTKGKFAREIEPAFSIFSKFAVIDDKIISCFPYSDKPIIIMNKNGEVQNSFGSLINKYDEAQRYSTNTWDILYNGDNIIAVNITDPVIDVYDINGNQINRYDLTDDKRFRSRYNYKNEVIRKDPSKRNSTFGIISHSAVQDSIIYLLYVENKNSSAISNKLLTYNIENENINEIRLTSSADIMPEYVISFSLNNNLLIAYDVVNSNLIKYKLIFGRD